ncbi:hypothetical protein [Bradyrhizobium sp. LHD-71]|uniref:hypothetical protein n=1 Tax=Bradyrhizobium sp. LHD-71 TaxID=3072141 RepID=UPI00280ED90B|nr:hypothetical protein [Bradyrhizobium sp. LHD-71]MDQ8726849.1 hypothetical protein [Bradyrhizobium sp. LHD-71]
MKQGTTALIAAAIVLTGTSALIAQPLPPMEGPPVYYGARVYYGRLPPPPYVYAPDDLAVPPYEVAAIMQSRGFRPLSRPARRGDFYVVSAIHPNGDDGRLVIDAYTGRVVRFVPASDAIRASRRDGMEQVYRGPTFPPPNARAAAPPPSARGVPRPPRAVPQVANRAPSAAPLATPKPRPQSAPRQPETAQAPPVPAPVDTKPAAVSPALEKPAEKKPSDEAASKPAVQPTQPLPPVQTME